LLRKGSDPTSVDERIRRANAGNAAALISIALGSGEQVERGSACFHYGTPRTHSPMGRRLAASIQHALVRRLGLPDCGLHPRSIAILRETRMPAARVEPAVALDELDASRIAETAFAGDVARAIADGVTAFSRPAPADIARST
jgi:N-acetylmuramoyl-L-alanine amidase